jgi:hypothetical protein
MRFRTRCLTIALILIGAAGFPRAGTAQGVGEGAAGDAYLRLLSAHFQVAASELRILAEGRGGADELPVALRIAELSGISPGAVMALRRTGASWISIARRNQVTAAAFHLSIPTAEVRPAIARAHTLYSETPVSGWGGLDLTDPELVAFANLAVLTRQLGLSAGRILDARESSGSFYGALPALTPQR